MLYLRLVKSRSEWQHTRHGLSRAHVCGKIYEAANRSHPKQQRDALHGYAPILFFYSNPRWSGYLACNALIRSSNSGRLRKLARLGSFRK